MSPGLHDKVYEADSLVCPRCGAETLFLSVTESIRRPRELWDPRPPSQAPPEGDEWPVNGQIPLTHEPLPPNRLIDPKP